MKLICIVGQPGAGKSYFAQNELMSKLPNYFVYDLYNYEYKDLPEEEPNKYKEGKKKYTGDDPELLLNSLRRFRNTAFIMEDATVFLDNHKKSEDFKRVIYGRRHCNLLIVLLFHSLHRVPVWIFEQTNIVVLFKTQDSEDTIKRKFKDPRILQAFATLKRSKNKHDKIILEMF